MKGMRNAKKHALMDQLALAAEEIVRLRHLLDRYEARRSSMAYTIRMAECRPSVQTVDAMRANRKAMLDVWAPVLRRLDDTSPTLWQRICAWWAS